MEIIKTDKRVNNGGARKGAGRKTKAQELELIERLTPLDNKAFKALEKGVNEGEFAYIKLFLEYRFGKPKQQIEVNTHKIGLDAAEQQVIYED